MDAIRFADHRGNGRPLKVTDPRVFEAGKQHDLWRRMRRERPVQWEGDFWSVTRYRDVERVLRDYESFTSERGTLLNLLGRGDPAGGRQLAATDPPAHDRMRQPLQRVMGSRSAASYEQELTVGIGRLLAPGRDGTEFDFAEATRALPLALVGPMLGIPENDWPALMRLVLMSSAEQDPDFQVAGGEEATLRYAHRELFGYFLDRVRERAKRPGDDLISLLLGTGASAGSVVSNCYSLLLGASATLPHVPASTLAELVRANVYQDWSRSDPASVVEEALRWSSPASHFMRYATRPVTLSGVDIQAGDAVVAWIGSANRDEDMFVTPDRLNLMRDAHRHLAFGTGHHYCLGAHLARFALRIFFSELFSAYTSFTITGLPARYRSTFLSGFKSLPVRGQPRTGGSG